MSDMVFRREKGKKQVEPLENTRKNKCWGGQSPGLAVWLLLNPRVDRSSPGRSPMQEDLKYLGQKKRQIRMAEWQNGSIAGKRIPFRRDWRWKLNGNAQVFKGWKRGQTASYGSKGMGPSTWENGCLYLANCVCSKDNYNLLTSLRHSPDVFAQKLDANPCSTPQYRSMPR